MSDSQLRELLRKRLQAVEERIGAACRRAGRNRNEVVLVAVTKTISAQTARLLPELGLRDLGESRPQELWHKAASLSGPVHWHLVGHLQRNKIEKTLPLVEWIHSVDSLRLLGALEEEAGRQGRPVRVLLQINASREASKHGFSLQEVPALPAQLGGLQRVRICGLMTLAAPEAAPERCRPTFAELRALRERLARAIGPPHPLEHLSMGMSNDFTIAIEEGATMIRLGTVLFDGIT